MIYSKKHRERIILAIAAPQKGNMKDYLIEFPGAEAFLHEHFGTDVQHIQELGRGEWSVAFTYRLDGHEYVARFGFFDEDFMKDRIVAQYTSERLPIPQIGRKSEIIPFLQGSHRKLPPLVSETIHHLQEKEEGSCSILLKS